MTNHWIILWMYWKQTDSAEYDKNATNTKLQITAKAFHVYEIVWKWTEAEDEIDYIQLMNFKRLQSLTGRKQDVGWK